MNTMLIAALLTSASVTSAGDVTANFGFSDARMCKMASGGEKIVKAMGAARRNMTVGALSDGQTLTARVTDHSRQGDTDRVAEIILPAGSMLHGLPVTRLRSKFYQKAESDAYRSREIVFATTPAKVRAMMRSLGAVVPPSPGYLAIPDPDDIENGAITIEGGRAATTLRCGWGL